MNINHDMANAMREHEAEQELIHEPRHGPRLSRPGYCILTRGPLWILQTELSSLKETLLYNRRYMTDRCSSCGNNIIDVSEN